MSQVHEYYCGFQCPECDHITLSKCAYIGEEDLPVVMWNSGECSEFECEECGAKFYTGDFDLLSEDEI